MDDLPIFVHHHSWGNGRVVPGQIRKRGNDVFMDVMFEHGIEREVPLPALSLLDRTGEVDAYLLRFLYG